MNIERELNMTHAEAIAAQNGILARISADLQDGGLNEAGRALYQCRKAIAEGAVWTAEELEWLAALDREYHAGCGYVSNF
jgi:hypothetical protein